MESALPGLEGAAIDALELVSEDDVQLASDAARRLLERGTTFDAVVCASDTLALGALMVLGSSVPIVGFDNTPVAEAVRFSSIEQPLEEVATAALELLEPNADPADAGASGGTDPFHRLLIPRTVWREPTGTPRVSEKGQRVSPVRRQMPRASLQ